MFHGSFQEAQDSLWRAACPTGHLWIEEEVMLTWPSWQLWHVGWIWPSKADKYSLLWLLVPIPLSSCSDQLPQREQEPSWFHPKVYPLRGLWDILKYNTVRKLLLLEYRKHRLGFIKWNENNHHGEMSFQEINFLGRWWGKMMRLPQAAHSSSEVKLLRQAGFQSCCVLFA